MRFAHVTAFLLAGSMAACSSGLVLTEPLGRTADAAPPIDGGPSADDGDASSLAADSGSWFPDGGPPVAPIEAGACGPGRTLAYKTPSCDGGGPVCTPIDGDASAAVYCGCDGVSYSSGPSYSGAPFAHIGFCQDGETGYNLPYR